MRVESRKAAKASCRLFGYPSGTVTISRKYSTTRTEVRVFDSWEEAKEWVKKYHGPLCDAGWPRRKPRNTELLPRGYHADEGGKAYVLGCGIMVVY